MAKDSYTEGYLKGYEDGLNEAWDDIIKMTTIGLTSREISYRAKAVIGTLYQKIDSKKHALSKQVAPVLVSEPTKRESQPASTFAIPEEGGCYIVRESKPDKSLKIFSVVVSVRQKGLCIARTESNIIKNSIRGSNIQFMFLKKSEEGSPNENCIQPDLSRIQSAIVDFMNANKTGVILLEGIHYLISQTDFGKVQRFIQSIRDDISNRKFSLIVPINPDMMDPKEYSQLEAEMQAI